MNTSKSFPCFIIIFELGIIGFIGHSLYIKKQIKNNVLGITNINPIKKENLILSPESELKYFYEPKPNITEEEKPLWKNDAAYYTINSDSLNERYDYDIQKASDTARIVILGDSFAFGQHIDTKNNWVEQLEHTLNTSMICSNINKYETINLGVRGYDIEYTIHRYKKRGKKYNPDIILWYMVDNDFTEINELISPMTESYRKKLTTEDYEKAALKNDYWPADKLGYIEFEQKYSRKFIYDYNHDLLKKFFTTDTDSQIFLILDESINEEQKTIIKNQHIQKNNILSTEITHLYTFPDGHPNLQSQKIIADYVFSFLKENYFTSCVASQSSNLQ